LGATAGLNTTICSVQTVALKFKRKFRRQRDFRKKKNLFSFPRF